MASSGNETSQDGSEKPLYKGLLNSEEVYSVLLHQLVLESKRFKDHTKRAENTPDINAWEAVRNGSNATETLQKLKSDVFKVMKEKMENHQVTSRAHVDGFLEKKVIRSFREHTERSAALIKYLENQIKSVQKLTTLLNNHANKLAESLAEKKEKEAMTEEQLKAEFRRKEQLLSVTHKKLVRGVRSVTAEIFPRRHEELDHILGILLEKSFNPDAYVDEEEGWEELVAFLVGAELVTRHPYQPRKIRLFDFM